MFDVPVLYTSYCAKFDHSRLNDVGGFRAESQNLAFRGPRGPGASKTQPPRGLVGHCMSGRPLNPPLLNDVGINVRCTMYDSINQSIIYSFIKSSIK